MDQKIAIIDYNAGNVQSVLFTLERIGIKASLTNDHQQILEADKVIFPGVGEANSTMNYLKKEGLNELIPSLKQPVLGICLGMQLLCEYSEENDTPCLGIIPQMVKKFIPGETKLKVPHMGWNTLKVEQEDIIDNSLEGAYAYFVHSYYVENGPYTVATTNYIHPFSCALRKDNFYATQFHPEKSGAVGQQIIQNFLSIKT